MAISKSAKIQAEIEKVTAKINDYFKYMLNICHYIY